MASQERLEYFISAAFKDEGVKQAMQAFGKLNAESAKVVNELNRISDAGARAGQKIRDSRTPYAQLGMQVNQLGTQLASGTSFAVAFAQQIGDVGWALQNAHGVLGTVGRFLAGPWGAAVAIAATALAPLIENLFTTKGAADEAKTSLDRFMSSLNQSSLASAAADDSVKKKIAALGQLGKINLQMQAEVNRIQKIGLSPQKTKEAIAASGYLNLLRQQAAAQQKIVVQADNELEQITNGLRIKAMQDTQAKIMNTTPDKAKIPKANNVANELKQQQSAYDALAERLRDAITLRSAETDEIGRAQKALDDFNDLVNKVRSTTVGDKLLGLGLTQELAPQIMQTRDALKQAIIDAQEWKLMIPTAASEATKAWEDQKAAIDSVAMSVNDAFKGMLTAGSSWKDGMKGIINTVINELWRLFVVQQIVGMVSKFVGGILGGGPVTDKMGGGTLISDFDKAFPKNANGTPSWQGGLTWVGERGPELVNLPRGAGVIPAHRASQMGGGGMTINVDARGSADPAAVRAQVQQGILEAAPAIVAAAQQRTVAGLRRPRLGGVMQ